MGNLFLALEAKMPGSNQGQRCKELWRHMQMFYKAFNVKDCLKHLTTKNYHGTATEPPKLKGGSAACTRALIRFGKIMAKRFLVDTDPREAAMKSAAWHLWQCYNSLGKVGALYRKEVFEESSRLFAQQYYALFLAVGNGVAWRVKPKMHLFLELCSEDTQPNLFWTYRDEDFAGTVARQCKMRGSWKKLSSFSGHALNMYCMKNKPPRLV